MEEQIENEIIQESEDDEDVVQGGWVTVTTNNVKEVSWPPPDHQAREKQMVGAVRSLPNLKGTVHMGKTRRQMMDMEFENVLKNSSAHYYSHPFTKGGFQPTKLNAEEKWSQSVTKHLSPSPTQNESDLDTKPRQIIKDAGEILTQTTSVRSSYKMPPGTSRTKRFQETYMKETTFN